MSSPEVKIIPLYKKEAETPLMTIEEFQKVNKQYKDIPLGYAGRLDPMAKGLLLVLAGDENLKRKEYERLPKTYIFEVLFGIATDTYDILGKITQNKLPTSVSLEQFQDLAKTYKGKHIQPYPPYSSPRIKGKSLFWWARENLLHTISIPKKEIEIFSFTVDGIREVTKIELEESILERLSHVKGDFRQKEIIEIWQRFFSEQKIRAFQIASCTITASSGTYVRSIANDLGTKLATNALAYSIERTAIGPYTLTPKKQE